MDWVDIKDDILSALQKKNTATHRTCLDTTPLRILVHHMYYVETGKLAMICTDDTDTLRKYEK